MDAKILISSTHNPYKNLALETYLFNTAGDDFIFFLWQNVNTVVIGKNQNAYKECNLNNMNNDHIRLARRSSGGGAVFHHLGNLNFTFITTRENYSLERNLSFILDALKNLGIYAEFSGRNDLSIDGKKFSGNAFLQNKTHRLHHGTLLINEDLSSISKYLNVNPLKNKLKGVESVQSRVVNISSFNDEITVERVSKALISNFKKHFETTSIIAMIEEINYCDLIEKYSSKEWIYGENPKSEYFINELLSFGELSIYLNISKNKISFINVYSDALDIELPLKIENALTGKSFSEETINAVLSEINIDQSDIDKLLNAIKAV